MARKIEEDSNTNMEDGRGWTPKNTKTETELELCYKKRHEGETRPNDRRRTRPESLEIENSMCRTKVGKNPKKKKNVYIPCKQIKQANSTHFAFIYISSPYP